MHSQLSKILHWPLHNEIVKLPSIAALESPSLPLVALVLPPVPAEEGGGALATPPRAAPAAPRHRHSAPHPALEQLVLRRVAEGHVGEPGEVVVVLVPLLHVGGRVEGARPGRHAARRRHEPGGRSASPPTPPTC